MQLRVNSLTALVLLSSVFILISLVGPTTAQEAPQELTPEEQLLYDVLVKRPSGGNHRYGFGLGKRSPEPMPAQPYLDEPTYSGFKRRQYNFGLGKRPWPMNDYEEYGKRKYNFGLGKRSE